MQKLQQAVTRKCPLQFKVQGGHFIYKQNWSSLKYKVSERQNILLKPHLASILDE